VKAVILAGGLGSRLSEETTVRPKPMVEIGGMPMLWHIMKLYAADRWAPEAGPALPRRRAVLLHLRRNVIIA
jgi:GTP:adenosylcobinamide-phosphate guanylyltransferase